MTTITATLPSGATDALDIDAIVTERFDDAATITQEPVEQGANISDHVRKEAEAWNLECIVTNSPLPPFSGDAHTRAEDARTKLLAWQNAGALLSIPTTLGLLTSMAVSRVSGTRDAKTGGRPSTVNQGSTSGNMTGGLRFTLTVQNIIIVNNRLTTVIVSKVPAVGPKTKTGTQATGPVDAEPSSTANNLATVTGGPVASITKAMSALAGGQ